MAEVQVILPEVNGAATAKCQFNVLLLLIASLCIKCLLSHRWIIHHAIAT